MAQKMDVVVQRLADPKALEMTETKTQPVRGRMNTMEQAHYRLVSAASVGHIDTMTELVQTGISPDSRSLDRRSALHAACAGGQLDAAKLLVEHKADVNAKDRFDVTPLDEALKSPTRSEPLIAYLVSQGAQITGGSNAENSLIALCAMAASPGNLDLAASLLKAKVNPNCSDYDGRTPLHLAVAESNVGVAKLLLDNGANPMAQDRWKNTPWAEVARHANRSGINEMNTLFETHPALADLKHSKFVWTDFALTFGGFQALIIILMFATATYGPSTRGGDAAVDMAKDKMLMYPFFQDVNVMIFIGFGYLMVFLRKNAFNSLGVTFLACVLVIQWHMLVDGFMVQAFCDATQNPDVCSDRWHKIPLGLDNMLFADFCAAAVMISYGALLGKISPLQMCCIAFIEVVCYAINENFGKSLKVADIGGTVVIHMFGAYFGLACSIALKNKNASTHVNNSSVYHSDLMAMVGTVFLWLYWPSFNGATAGTPATQQRVVLNTFLSISASCLMAFVASHLLRREKKFNMVDIQNATLAGGVAMGSAADMMLSPGAAVSIGSIAGSLSVIGFVYIQPFLEAKIGFHDTCGVNNLHGMPSILGALSGVIASSLAQSGPIIAGYGDMQLKASFPLIADGTRTAQTQALNQLAFIGVTLGFALITGALTGLLIRSCTYCKSPDGELLFNDAPYWETPQLENPYYFDRRGEIQRGEGDRGENSSELAHRVKVLEDRERRHSATSKEDIEVGEPRNIARAHIRRLIHDDQDKAQLFALLDQKLIDDLTDPHTNDGERLAALTLKLHPPSSAPETVLAQMWREILDSKKKGL